MTDEASRLPEKLRFEPSICYLTEDLDVLRSQLDGTSYDWDGQAPLINNISTDELTPGWVCFHYDETLGDYVFVGLRGNVVKKDDFKKNGFEVIVSGLSKGCGSSRETAPFAEKAAGAKLVVAKTIEKIYGQNCLNIGLLTTTNFDILEQVKAGEEIALSEFTEGLDPISKNILIHGGLFPYNKARLAGQVSPPKVETAARPMTLVEKIIARRAIADASTGSEGITAVKPGDALFVRTDVRFSHEYVTPMAASLFIQALGEQARVNQPENVYAFRDHLTFLGQVMPEERKEKGFLKLADGLAITQKEFCESQNINYYGEVDGGRGSEAICHNAVLEDIGLPGQIIIGTDSHTCTAGALGAFAYGVGSTDMANSWFTRDTRLKVPESVRYNLSGQLKAGVSAKDLMLYIMSQDFIKEGKAIGKVLEFGGDGALSLSLDERATVTNMAVEAGATTGIIQADDVVVDYIVAQRGLDADVIREGIVTPDAGATYLASFDIDLSAIDVMVATPGDPRNGVPITSLNGIPINIAYGGSCTGGKKADMDMYAEALKGSHVADGVDLYIQFGSQKIKKYAREQGYIELFEEAGATLIDPSCGACINAGPGVSKNPDQITVSAINRNFPGRSGPGQVYLASPRVVAASAIAGRISAG